MKRRHAMKLGCNYSDALMKAMAVGDADVDYIKIGYFPPFMGMHDEVFAKKPLLIHGFGHYEHIGMPDAEGGNPWPLMNDVLTRYGSPHLAAHLAYYDSDRRNGKTMEGAVDESLVAFKKNLAVPVLVENIDYNPNYDKVVVSESIAHPDYIWNVCEHHEVDLLLDIAHAAVSADHMNLKLKDYIRALPLNRVKEIHATGHGYSRELGVLDNHEMLEKGDYEILDFILARSNPDILTLEYGWPGEAFLYRSNYDKLLFQLGELRKWL